MVSLQSLNTFHVPAQVPRLTVGDTMESIQQWADQISTPFLILGGGSNLLFTQSHLPFDTLHVQLKGIEILEDAMDHVNLKVAAGELWHSFVIHCVEHGYCGIENLALIPGQVGAGPIQNIGAYGRELKDVCLGVHVLHIKSGTTEYFTNKQCDFGYRDSIFKRTLKGEVIITAVEFQLSKIPHILLDYGDIKKVLHAKGIQNPGIKEVAEAVIEIRSSKLPNPDVIGNAGSFFKNPVVPEKQFKQLKTQFPDMPGYHQSGGGMKIPAGWCIEQAGWKGRRVGDAGCHGHHALVLVNYGKATGEEIFELARDIQNDILQKFDLNLEIEVNLIPG